MKKAISMLLILTMCIPLLFSCASSKTEGGDTETHAAAAETTAAATETAGETAILPDLPDVTYDNYVFHIYNTTPAQKIYTYVNFAPQALTGDTISDTTYNRNLRVEERFKIKIEEFQVSSYALNTVTNLIMSGDDSYDIYMYNMDNIMKAVSAGLLLNLYDVDNLDFSKPWWDQNHIASISFGKKVYAAVSDFEMTHFEQIRVMYFNKKLFTDKSLENPYKLVDDGKWTLEKMTSIAKEGINDADGDGKFGAEDEYGIVCAPDNMFAAMLAGCKAFVIERQDDLPVIADQTTLSDKFNRIYDLMNVEHIYYNAGSYSKSTDFFSGNKTLFEATVLGETARLRATEFDFGILPFPKLNESDEVYLSYCPNPYAMTIPVTAKDPARTGAIMECMSYESYDSLVPAYIETMLKGRVTRDEESIGMLDIILNNVTYLTRIISSTGYGSALAKQLSANAPALASWMAKMTTQLEKDIENTKTVFEIGK